MLMSATPRLESANRIARAAPPDPMMTARLPFHLSRSSGWRKPPASVSVSYTHLTLPTIYSV